MDLSSSVSSLLTIHNGVVVGVVTTNSFPKTQYLRTSFHHGLHGGGGGCGFHSFFLFRGGGGIQGLQALRGSHGRKLGFELAQNGGVMKMKVMCSSNSSSSSREPSSSSTTSDSKNSASGAPAAATSTSSTSTSLENEDSGFLKRVFEVPRSLWQQLVMRPLMRGFVGFGKRGSVWKGGVGMFVMAGAVLLAITLIWVNGKQIRGATTRKYEVVLQFATAQGITVGTSVRIRGVEVGNVVEVRPSLQRIDAVVELVDSGIVIPRNALVEVNQSGLVSETLIDITPRLPLPKPSLGPLDPGCSDEGLIVCDRERIKGEQGVSLDELVGICIKLARQVDDMGVANMADMAERLEKAVEEAKPLLSKAQLMAEDIGPLLKEMREGELLKDLAYLMKFATKSGRDLGVLSKSVLTSENRHLLQDSVSTLSKALKQVESISADVSSVTGDARTRHNLRQLIETLSRLVTD
ncbi:hypothetical protein CY35_06G042000 [Sphagnum magellanicum]|nr:hypothetical protein CY35_06G042000 [Sphagnum magellanicum]KAH9559110.1 hypothetical protein CY35_06G042000 [Sphagnum magellanicum]KAH9559111.1 hypothetical protein CY35_06G042000 [Sphagnum magellanicum]